MIGEEYRALLSSYSGTDGSFYVLVDHDNYNEFIEKVLHQITDDFQAPALLRPLMMVCVRYDGKYSRAWIKSIESKKVLQRVLLRKKFFSFRRSISSLLRGLGE